MKNRDHCNIRKRKKKMSKITESDVVIITTLHLEAHHIQ